MLSFFLLVSQYYHRICQIVLSATVAAVAAAAAWQSKRMKFKALRVTMIFLVIWHSNWLNLLFLVGVHPLNHYVSIWLVLIMVTAVQSLFLIRNWVRSTYIDECKLWERHNADRHRVVLVEPTLAGSGETTLTTQINLFTWKNSKLVMWMSFVFYDYCGCCGNYKLSMGKISELYEFAVVDWFFDLDLAI